MKDTQKSAENTTEIDKTSERFTDEARIGALVQRAVN
jgi:hypothetical protein